MDGINYIVVKVKPEDDYVLLVDFIDGSQKRFDMKPLIERGGVFEKLRDKELFNKARIGRDTLIWDDVLDIAPESLYDKGVIAR